ncbi:MAG: metal-dependent hydrolase [Thermodesulfobacteriota bacterium]
MDTTTHALAGYVLGEAGLNRGMSKWGTIAAVAAAVFPDIDLVLGIFGTDISLKYHRSLTNSLFLLIPFALLFSWLFVKISKIRKFWSYFLIWVIIMYIHTFMDLATSYGTMLLSPLSDHRFALDWLFIIDLYLVGALLIPFIASYLWKRRRVVLVRISLVLAILYYGMCAWNHSQALSLAGKFVQENGLNPIALASLPQPLSPFNWGNYILTEDTIYQGFVNLIAAEDRNPDANENFVGRFFARYQPAGSLQYRKIRRFDESPWVEKAMKLEGTETFFWFARFPVGRDRGVINGKRRVAFYDLRFDLISQRNPFVYAVDFDAAGKVVFQGFL